MAGPLPRAASSFSLLSPHLPFLASDLNPFCSSTEKVLLASLVTTHYLKRPHFKWGSDNFPGLQQLAGCPTESKHVTYWNDSFVCCQIGLQGYGEEQMSRFLVHLPSKTNVKDCYCQYYDCGFQHFYQGRYLETERISPTSETKTAYLVNNAMNRRLRKMMLCSRNARDHMNPPPHLHLQQ